MDSSVDHPDARLDPHKHDPSAQLCSELLPELGAYLDGEAAAEVCSAIESHLALCPDCRILVDTMRKSIQLARDLPNPRLTDEAKERLLAILSLP